MLKTHLHLRWTSLLAFVTALPLMLPALYCLAAMSASISPPKMEFNLQPGRTAKEVIEVKNQDIAPIDLKVYTTGFHISEDGSLNYSSAKAYSAESWLRVVPDHLTIGPNDYNIVRYEVQVPEGTANGSYTASIQMEEATKDAEAGAARAQMQIKGRLAYIVYVNVGKPSYSGSIESFAASTDANNILFRVRLRNDGIYYIRPTGKIIIEKDGSKVKEEPYPNLPVLAHQTRMTEVKVPKDLGAGSYKAKISIDIGVGKSLSAETSFSL